MYITRLNDRFTGPKLINWVVLCIGTPRKNAAGVPSWLVELKNKNWALIWNSTFAEIVNGVLCFLWQDNNAVLGITTGYDLAQRVLPDRKRPNFTSTNGHIVQPVFSDQARKRLWIPKVIDEYNHNMNGVDLVNQLRSAMTVNRPLEHRIRHSLWHFCIHIVAVNAYICWRYGKASRDRRHRPFRQELVKALLAYPLESQAQGGTPKAVDRYPGHSWTNFGKRGYCEWCRRNQKDNLTRRRVVLGEIPNQATPVGRIRPGISHGGCRTCNIMLCASGTCFRKYHSIKMSNTV